MRMPGRLGDTALHQFRGRVRFRRAFGYPGRIDEHERVWLTLAGIEGQAVVALNGQILGESAGPGEFEVTPLLLNRNVLTVDVECSGPGAGLWGEVALEVRATAFLRHVHFDFAGVQLRATGLVVGKAEGALDLYLLAENRCQAYCKVTATEPGQPFTLTAPLPEPPAAALVPVRVELVHGATVWYVVEGTVKTQSNPGADSSYS
jgi:hypothetical protein